MAGDKILPPRPRMQSNERLDLVDVDRFAAVAQDGLEAENRAIISTPKATAGAAVGERWVGSITANPTSGSDNTVRVDTAVFVGLDANGKLVIKPAGTTLSTTIPSGGADHQVYLYMQDVPEDSQTRRFIPVTAPFNEFTQAINVTNRQAAALYVRAGGLGSVVAEDAVSGVTRSLLLLGIASNTGGNVTFTAATNTLETVTAPAGVPTSNAGSVAGETFTAGIGASTLRELTNHALHANARNRWKGSNNFTASATNNFGAYTEPPGGIDAAFRGRTVVTIGDDTASVFGDVNRAAFANDSLALAAAVALLDATDGGSIYIKPNVVLTLAADVLIDRPVKIFGEVSKRSVTLTPINMVTFKFNVTMTVNVANRVFALENISLQSLSASATGTFIQINSDEVDLLIRNCFLDYFSDYAASAGTYLIQYGGGVITIGNVLVDNTGFRLKNSATNTATGLYNSSTLTVSSFAFRDCVVTLAYQTLTPIIFNIQGVGASFALEGCRFLSSGAPGGGANGLTCFFLRSGNVDPLSSHLRKIKACSFHGQAVSSNQNMIALDSLLENLTVEDCTFLGCTGVFQGTIGTQRAFKLAVDNCRFHNIYKSPIDYVATGASSSISEISVTGCILERSSVSASPASAAIRLSGTGIFRRIDIGGNRIVNMGLELISAITEYVNIYRNTVYWTIDATVANTVQISASNTLAFISVVDNHFDGMFSTTLTNYTIVNIIGSNECASVSVSGNTFSKVQNALNWAGAVTEWKVVNIEGLTTQDINVNDNRFYQVCFGVTGANARSMILVHVGHSNAQGGFGAGLLIKGNNMGIAEANDITPIVMRHLKMQNVGIEDNHFSYIRNGLAKPSAYADIAIGNDVFTPVTMHGISVTGNVLRFTGAASAMSTSAMSMAGTFSGVRINDNLFVCTGSAGFDTNNGMQFSNGTFNYWTFYNNQAVILGDLTANNAKFSYQAGATVNVTEPAHPALNAYWANNQNIKRTL